MKTILYMPIQICTNVIFMSSAMLDGWALLELSELLFKQFYLILFKLADNMNGPNISAMFIFQPYCLSTHELWPFIC